jgi:signal transduction histidine kinase
VEELVERLPPAAESGAILDRVVDASALVARTVAATRSAVAVLRPATLDLLGLVPALRQACREFTARSGVPCEPNLPPDLALDADAELALFRIAQEALTNVARHAGGARRVAVALHIEPAALVLRVEDDGVGLPRTGGLVRGLGIVGMRERAARLGGELSVTSPPGGGTLVVARLPRAAGRAVEGVA